MKTDVLQIIASGDPGGGTTAVLTLSRLLEGAGVRVTVVSQRHSYLLDAAASLGLPTCGLDFTTRGAAIGRWRALAALLPQLGAEVVHAHGSRAALPVALARCLDRRARGSGRFVYTVHGFHFLAKPAPARQLGQAAERFCLRHADWANFVSHGDARLAREGALLADAQRSSVIPNATLADEMPPPQPADCDIAFLGRLEPQKNPLVLPEILAALRPARPTLRVIGGGSLEQPLRRKLQQHGVADQVAFCGRLPRAAALEQVARCRMLLLPSLWEGHPIALIEAMHLGLPAVASAVAGNDEIVRPGRTGFLVAPDDVAGYAAALRRLLDARELARAFGAAARAEAQLHYSAEGMLQRHLEIYRADFAHGAP